VGQFYILQLDGHLLITYLQKTILKKSNILHDLISFPGLLEKYYFLKNPENKGITVGLFRITENSN
jgi:hypothetical protein